MKTIYVSDLKSGSVLNGESFAVVEKKLSTDKNGNNYYDLVLADKTGQVKGKIWSDHFPNVDKAALEVGRIVQIDASVGEFRGSVQLTIRSVSQVNETALDDFIETSMFPADDMWAELLQQVAEIKDEHVRGLVTAVLNDPDTGRKLKFWPAAVSVHHDFRSGLLQHILEMLQVADGLQKFYPNIDFDLVTAGIILHDIGKTMELDASGITPMYSKEGTLLGHIYMGVRLLEKFLPEGFPQNKWLHIQHIILSHHGALEFGSPVLPASPEAVMITNIDKVSADTRRACDMLRRFEVDEQGMTEYNRWMQTRVWNGQ